MFLDRFRAPVSAAISSRISFLREQYQLPQYFLVQLFDNLEDYTLRGKLIRGSLIPFTYYHLAGTGGDGRARRRAARSRCLLAGCCHGVVPEYAAHT